MMDIVLYQPQPPNFVCNVLFTLHQNSRDSHGQVVTYMLTLLYGGHAYLKFTHMHTDIHIPRRKTINFLTNVLFQEFKN